MEIRQTTKRDATYKVQWFVFCGNRKAISLKYQSIVRFGEDNDEFASEID